eukprot:318051_1
MSGVKDKVQFYVKRTTTTAGYGNNVEKWKNALLGAMELDHRRTLEGGVNTKRDRKAVDGIKTVQVDSTEDVRLSRLKVTFTCKDENTATKVSSLLNRLRSFQNACPGLGNSWDAFPLTRFTECAVQDETTIEVTTGDSQVTHLLETGMRQRRDTGHGAADRRD